jgi:lectin-like protein
MSRSLSAALISAAVSCSIGCGFFSLDEAGEPPAKSGAAGKPSSGGTGGASGGTTGGSGGSTGGAGGVGTGGGGMGGSTAGMGAGGSGMAGDAALAGGGPAGGTGNAGGPPLGGAGGDSAAGGLAGTNTGGMAGTGPSGCAALNPAAKAHAGHCYLLVTSAITWPNAKAACTSLGAHLVTISSAAPLTQADFDGENSYVFDELGGKKETWIGLSDGKLDHDNGDGAVFAWVTDEPLTLSNWNDNEPNHYQKNCMDNSSCYEHCAFMMADPAGKWNDELCEATKQYVCEWDMGG